MPRLQLSRERDSRWSVAATLLGGGCLIATLVAVLVHAVTTPWQPVLVLTAVAHQLMWSAPISVALFAVVRRWYACGVAAIALVAVVLIEAPLYVGATDPHIGAPMTILQANLRVGNADPDALVRLVTTQHVDLLMTEELTAHERDSLLVAGLARALPYRFDAALAGGGGGLAIWSRRPLAHEENYPHYQLGVLSATMDLAGRGRVIVVAAHLLPPYPYPSRTWVAEIRRLSSLLSADAARDATVIVGGDFNATTDDGQLRQLLHAGYQDAAEHSGAGYLASYPTDRWFPPIIAIDHVITRRAPASDATLLSLPGSDHDALLVHVRVQP